jgi:hypothetical protein
MASFPSLICVLTRFLAIASVCSLRLHLTGATQGNWRIEADPAFKTWTSSELPLIPSATANEQALITDISARIIARRDPTVFTTFAAGESLMLPLCSTDSIGNYNNNQDSSITFDPSSVFSLSFLNGSTGQLTHVIPPTSTPSLSTGTVQISYGFLKVTFSSDLYVPDCTIIISLTKLKVASGTNCVASQNSRIKGIRASQPTSITDINYNSFSSLLYSSVLQYNPKFPRVMTASLSDSRPSRPTGIRITAQNSFLSSFPYGCSQAVNVQLPLYFGRFLNASTLTASVIGSTSKPQDQSFYKPNQAKVSNLVFDPIGFSLSGSAAPAAPFACSGGRFSGDGEYVLDMSGFQTPSTPSSHNLQLAMMIGSDTYNSITVPVLFPAIETISNARISFGSSSVGSVQIIVSFATSFDVLNICGPGDNSNLKQRIVLRIHGATQFCGSSSGQITVTGSFLSVPKNSPVRIGKVAVSLNVDVCEVSLYLSSGDALVAGCTQRTLPAPDLPSTPITFSIDGLKIPDVNQPPMPVSIDIDEGSPSGVTQTCSKCAEWPSTPTFSGSVELASKEYSSNYRSLVTTLHDIGSISALDTLSIQIPRGIGHSTLPDSSSINSIIVCTGSKLGTPSTEKFDIKSIYPNLVLQWKSGNAVLSSKSIEISCTWSASTSTTLNWFSSFDANPSYDLTIEKHSGSEPLRRIRTGYSPGRYTFAAMTATLSDKRPGFTTKFTIFTLRGSFRTIVLIPALGFSLTSNVIASCSCQPSARASIYEFNPCGSAAIATADLEKAGDFIKLSGFTSSTIGARFNNCTFTIKNPNAVGAQGSGVAYIDDLPDVLYSAPSISGIGRVSVTISQYLLDTAITATISFAHSQQLSTNSQIRLSGFCNFATQNSLAVAFEGGIQASVALAGCEITITINSGTLLPPLVGSEVRCIISNLKTPTLRQARGVVSMSTYTAASALLDSCFECAYVSELPLFAASFSLSSTSPGATNVEFSIRMNNVWQPFAQGNTIFLASSSASLAAFPGDWKGPASGFKMLVNGASCDATVTMASDGLQITHMGTASYASLDITIQLGPYYTVPRKLLKAFSIKITKSASAVQSSDSVSAAAVYPEISGNCPAGHSLNSTSTVCERCNRFRYNDGTMSQCQVCLGQGIGEANLKATKCVPFCTWPFEYEYDKNVVFDNSCRLKDGGICSQFASDNIEDKECTCDMSSYYYGGPSPSTYGTTASSGNCAFVNLNANVPAVATIFSFFIIIFVICIFRLPSKPGSTIQQWLHCKGNLMFLAFFPTLDFLSDLVYILTSKFYRIEIFVASTFFFVLPMYVLCFPIGIHMLHDCNLSAGLFVFHSSYRFMFMRQLMRHRAYIHFYLVKVPKALELKEYDNM